MNKGFSIGPLKGYLWLQESSPTMFKSSTFLYSEISLDDATPISVNKNCIATLEVFIPRGPRVLYGHVGGVYKPKDNPGSVSVEVYFVNQLLQKCDSGLAAGAGESYVGLERNYAEAVLSGLEKALTSEMALPPGVIIINCGVISKFGSAPIVYEKLGERLCNVFFLHMSGKKITEDIFRLGI